MVFPLMRCPDRRRGENIDHTQEPAKRAGRKEEIEMKKLLALVMAGAMLISVPVMAADSPSAAVVAESSQSEADAVVEAAAAASNMTVGEYRNNAVVSIPGIGKTMPIGQGGHVIINGAPSNVTFNLMKPSQAEVSSAKTLNGSLLTVVGTKAAIRKFDTARVNFWLQGVVAGQNIKVYQLVNGVWVEVPVVEIREDHVVVDLNQHGVLAFVEVPVAAEAAEAE